MSDFWKTVFQKLNTRLLTSTSYHPQTDGQSERTNQVLEIALRFFFTSHPEKDWTAVIPFFQGGINNISNASTGHSPNKIVYGFRVRDTLNALLDLPQDLPLSRSIMRQEASDAISFANVVMKQRYDQKHRPIQMEVGSYAYLRLHKGYTIPGLRNRKLSPQRVGPFLIKRKVGNLAYKLQIAPVMRIHPVISIAQLEAAPKKPDSFNRMRHIVPPPVVEGGDVFEVERILGKRMSRKKTQYLVKWFGYGGEHDVCYNEEDLSEAQEAVKDYEFWHETHPQTQSRKKSSHDKDNATTTRHLHPVPPKPVPPKPRDSTSSTQAVASSSSSSPKPILDLALTPWADRLRPRR